MHAVPLAQHSVEGVERLVRVVDLQLIGVFQEKIFALLGDVGLLVGTANTSLDAQLALFVPVAHQSALSLVIQVFIVQVRFVYVDLLH